MRIRTLIAVFLTMFGTSAARLSSTANENTDQLVFKGEEMAPPPQGLVDNPYFEVRRDGGRVSAIALFLGILG